MRSQPDSIDNIFNALVYFAVPKSFLDRKVGMYLLIKDEEEASLSSMPRTLVGHSATHEGRDLGLTLQELLFEPGHPTVAIDIELN